MEIYVLNSMSWVGSTMMNSELLGSSVFVLVAETQLVVKWVCSSWKQLSLLLLVHGEQVLGYCNSFGKFTILSLIRLQFL